MINVPTDNHSDPSYGIPVLNIIPNKGSTDYYGYQPYYSSNNFEGQNGYYETYPVLKSLPFHPNVSIKSIENAEVKDYNEDRHPLQSEGAISTSQSIAMPEDINRIGRYQYSMNGTYDKVVKLTDLIKLTEAIRELTSRLPLPPSQELLQSVHPNMAVNLQLAYLKAYINNQQLLMDLKSSIETVIPNVDMTRCSLPNVPLDSIDSIPLISEDGHGNPTMSLNLSNLVPNEIVDLKNVSIPSKLNTVQDNTYTLSNSVPPNLRNSVKYDANKHAFVAVFLGPLGLRKRKAFSVRKFGVEKALKLATNCASSATCNDVVFAKKERGLLDDVCETVFKLNKEPCADVELYEKALELEETRGLVYSCGGQMWLSITYDSRGHRCIKEFLVSEYGFRGAHNAALKHLNTVLQDSEYIGSKLSGALGFWMEEVDGIKILCIISIFNDLIKNVENKRIFIGRFEIYLNGGVVNTRKIAQKWRNKIKYESFPSESLKTPGVYYNSSRNTWITNCNIDGSRNDKIFNVLELGFKQARLNAIELRRNVLNKSNQLYPLETTTRTLCTT